MSEAPSKSFTSQKLDLQHRICADRRVTDGQFRMFVRVLKAMNETTRVAVIGDETIMAEVPSCGSPSTCKANRRNLQAIGYWTVKPGSGDRTTEYTINLKAAMALVAGLDELRSKRIQRRRQTTAAWRARKAAVRHGDVGLQEPQPIDAVRHAHTGVVRHGDVGQSVMQDPPYTFITPSTETPSNSATEGRLYSERTHEDVSPDRDELAMMVVLGAGDQADGRDLADYVPPGLLTNALQRVRVFGAEKCKPEILHAREQALARRAAARRASA